MFKVTSTKTSRDLTIPPQAQDILLFDEEGKINVAKFNDVNHNISHYAQSNEPTIYKLDYTKIAGANIIYRLASRPNVRIFEVPREIVIEHIIANISDDIVNKPEVADQLYCNWVQMNSSQYVIQNVAANRFSFDTVDGLTDTKELAIIPNYSMFIQRLLNSYISTIIDSDDHKNFKTKEFLYVTELLLSTFQGRNFDLQNVILHDTIRSHLIQATHQLAQENKSIDSIRILQEMLEQENGLWYKIDLHYLDGELESLKDYDKNEIKEAFKNLLSGKLENFTTNKKLKDDLEGVLNTLTPYDISNNLYRECVTNRTTRCVNKPSLSYFIEATKFYIYEKLKSQGFDIEIPTIAENFKNEHLLQPTIWDQPAPPEEEIDRKCSQTLEIDYRRDMENGEARENSFVLTAGIDHRQDCKAWWLSNYNTGQIKLSLELNKDEAEKIYEFYTQKVPNLIREYGEDENAEIAGNNFCFTLDSRIFCRHALPIMIKEGVKNEVFNNPRVEERYRNHMGLGDHQPVSHVQRLGRSPANGPQGYDTVDAEARASYVGRLGRSPANGPQGNDTVDAENQTSYQDRINLNRSQKGRSSR